MKFNVSTSGNFYYKEDKEILESIGFNFKVTDFNNYDFVIIDSDVTVEINTLQELIEFTEKFGQVIFSGKHLEIYDDYRE